MTNVVGLHGTPIPEGRCLNKDVLRLLKELQEMAERGEIAMLAVTWVNGAGHVTNEWTEGEGRLKLIAGCEFLKYDLMTKSYDEAIEEK